MSLQIDEEKLKRLGSDMVREKFGKSPKELWWESTVDALKTAAAPALGASTMALRPKMMRELTNLLKGKLKSFSLKEAQKGLFGNTGPLPNQMLQQEKATELQSARNQTLQRAAIDYEALHKDFFA